MSSKFFKIYSNKDNNLNSNKWCKVTYVLMKSIVCAFSWSALCKSASIRVSAAVSTDKFTHNASSHITLSFSRAYYSDKCN